MAAQSQIIDLLTASLIRPVALAAAAWLVLRLYKVRHPASRHAVWTAVLIGMMLLPLVSVFGPQWKLPLLPKKQETVAPIQIQQHEDFTDISPNSVTTVQSQDPKPAWPTPQGLIVWLYLIGVFAMAIFRLTGWALLWRVMSKSRSLRTRLRESSEVITPVTVGVLRPSVILPAGWRNWNANTKRAVLAHEFAHIRRRDTLTSSLTRFAKCIYWFHPLAWWISQQISELAELSCDAAALEKNGDPASYSRILLSFAETVNAAGYRAALPGLAIASRSGMSHRIDQVFELASGNLRRLSRPGTVLALMGLPVMCIAAVVGLTAPASHVLQQATAAITTPKPVLVAQSQLPSATPPKPAPPAPAPRPKFDVASIKPCAPGDGAGMGRGGGDGAGSAHVSPGKLNIACMTVPFLINVAYVQYADNPLINNSGENAAVRQGPEWARSDRYTIEAATDDPVANGPTTPGGPAVKTLMGPMLQTLLEDRFKLRIHRDTEEVPTYSLTVARGGLKLRPMKEGDCTPLRDLPRPYPPMVAGDKPRCSMIVNGWNGPNRTHDAHGVALTAAVPAVDRPVIDKTGIAGMFDIHLEYAPDENTPGRGGTAPPADPNSAIPPGQTIFTALEQQLGLKLVADKGPRGYIAIDHIERPSEN